MIDMIDKLHIGDAKEILKRLPSDSVDLMVTDPPYQLSSISRRFSKDDGQSEHWRSKNDAFYRMTKGFMGKEWDVIPEAETWRECLRVLKPGAFAFILCTPRQDSLAMMITRLSESGFDIGFTSLFWAYATGFPKGTNISKQVDKRLGMERDVVGYTKPRASYEPFGNFSVGVPDAVTAPNSDLAMELSGAYSGFQPKPAVEPILVAMKPIQRLYRQDFWQRDKYDYFYTKRVIISEKNKVKLEKAWDREFNLGDIVENRIAINPELNDEVILNRTEVLQSRPYKNSELTSFLSQAMWNRKGLTWIDDARIPCTPVHCTTGQGKKGSTYNWSNTERDGRSWENDRGRFPANLLISDDILDDGEERKASAVGHQTIGWKHSGNTSDVATPLTYQQVYEDEGSFSKFFNLDAWFEARLAKLPVEIRRTFPFFIISKPTSEEKNRGCEQLTEKKMGRHQSSLDGGEMLTGSGNKRSNYRKNSHPTVKPIKLLSYLVTLGSQENDVVLDPFIGSGTTALACLALGRRYIGIEVEAEYVEIAEARIADFNKQLRLF